MKKHKRVSIFLLSTVLCLSSGLSSFAANLATSTEAQLREHITDGISASDYITLTSNLTLTQALSDLVFGSDLIQLNVNTSGRKLFGGSNEGFVVEAGKTLNLYNITFQNFSKTSDGAFLHNSGTALIFPYAYSIEISNNYANGNGGAVYNAGDLTLQNRAGTSLTFSNNGAGGLGGAIYNAAGATLSILPSGSGSIIFSVASGANSNDIYNLGSIIFGDSSNTGTINILSGITGDSLNGTIDVNGANVTVNLINQKTLNVNSGSFTIPISGLTLADSSILNKGTLTLEGADTETSWSKAITNNSAATGSVVFKGNINSTANIGQANFTNSNTFVNNGALTLTALLTNSGAFTNSAGATVSTLNLTNNASKTFDNKGNLAVTGTFTNAGIFNNTGAFTGNITNSGTVDFLGGSFGNGQTITNSNYGIVKISVADFINDGTIGAYTLTLNENLKGTGTLSLFGTNDYSGNTKTIEQTEIINKGSLTINPDNITSKITTDYENSSYKGILTIKDGSNANIIEGSGSVVISGDVSNTGKIEVSKGISIETGKKLTTNADKILSEITANAGTLSLTGGKVTKNITSAGILETKTNTVTNNSSITTSLLALTSSLTTDGDGTLTLRGVNDLTQDVYKNQSITQKTLTNYGSGANLSYYADKISAAIVNSGTLNIFGGTRTIDDSLGGTTIQDIINSNVISSTGTVNIKADTANGVLKNNSSITTNVLGLYNSLEGTGSLTLNGTNNLTADSYENQTITLAGTANEGDGVGVINKSTLTANIGQILSKTKNTSTLNLYGKTDGTRAAQNHDITDDNTTATGTTTFFNGIKNNNTIFQKIVNFGNSSNKSSDFENAGTITASNSMSNYGSILNKGSITAISGSTSASFTNQTSASILNQGTGSINFPLLYNYGSIINQDTASIVSTSITNYSGASITSAVDLITGSIINAGTLTLNTPTDGTSANTNTISSTGKTIINTALTNEANITQGNLTINKVFTNNTPSGKKVTIGALEYGDSIDGDYAINGTGTLSFTSSFNNSASPLASTSKKIKQTKVENSGQLTYYADRIEGAIDNYNTITLLGGTNTNTISSPTAGVGTINISGALENNSSITTYTLNLNEAISGSGSLYLTGTNNLATGGKTLTQILLHNTGSLTINPSNVTAPITNNYVNGNYRGYLTLVSGSNANEITGSGKTFIAGQVENNADITQEAGIEISKAATGNPVNFLKTLAGHIKSAVTNNGKLHLTGGTLAAGSNVAGDSGIVEVENSTTAIKNNASITAKNLVLNADIVTDGSGALILKGENDYTGNTHTIVQNTINNSGTDAILTYTADKITAAITNSGTINLLGGTGIINSNNITSSNILNIKGGVLQNNANIETLTLGLYQNILGTGTLKLTGTNDLTNSDYKNQTIAQSLIENYGGTLTIDPSKITAPITNTYVDSNVNTPSFTNAAGIKIKTDPLNVIEIEPGVRLIGNFENGLQPYLGVSMIWNILDKSRVTANDTALTELSIEPYVRYGLGIQKRWGKNVTGFFQAFVTQGGRNGIGLEAGLNWLLGKEIEHKKLTSSPIPDKEKPEIKLSRVKFNKEIK